MWHPLSMNAGIDARENSLEDAGGQVSHDALVRGARVGAAIRLLRESQSLTQDQLGVRAGGVPQTTVSRWEGGRVQLSVEQVFQLEDAMGTPHGTILAMAGMIDSGLTPADIDDFFSEAPVTVGLFRRAVRSMLAAVTEVLSEESAPAEEATLSQRVVQPSQMPPTRKSPTDGPEESWRAVDEILKNAGKGTSFLASQLVPVAEAAAMIGLDESTMQDLMLRDEFPLPVVQADAGAVVNLMSVDRFLNGDLKGISRLT